MPFFYLLDLIFLTIRFLPGIIFNLLFNKDFLPAICLFWVFEDLMLFFFLLNLLVPLSAINILLPCNVMEAALFGLLPLFLAAVLFGELAACSFNCFFFKNAFIPLTFVAFLCLVFFFIAAEEPGFTVSLALLAEVLVSGVLVFFYVYV